MSWLMLGSAFGCVEGERYVFVNHSIASCNRDDAELRKYPHLNCAASCWWRVDESCERRGCSTCNVGPLEWAEVICMNHWLRLSLMTWLRIESLPSYDVRCCRRMATLIDVCFVAISAKTL